MRIKVLPFALQNSTQERNVVFFTARKFAAGVYGSIGFNRFFFNKQTNYSPSEFVPGV